LGQSAAAIERNLIVTSRHLLQYSHTVKICPKQFVRSGNIWNGAKQHQDTHFFPCFDALPERLLYRIPPRTLIASMSVL